MIYFCFKGLVTLHSDVASALQVV